MSGPERDEFHPVRPDGPAMTGAEVVRSLGPTAAVLLAMGLVAYRVGGQVRVFSGPVMVGRQNVDAAGLPVGPWESIVHTIDDGFCQPPRPIVGMVPQGVDRDPRFAHLRNPVTVDHSPWACERCGAACWIGPTQKALVTGPAGAEAICFGCAAKDGRDIAVTLNPDIEDRPRRGRL